MQALFLSKEDNAIMDKPRVFVTRRIQDVGIRLLEGAVDYSIWDSVDPPPREVLLERAKDVDGMLTMLSDRIDEEFLSNAPGIKVVSNYAVGYDNIDVPAATRRHSVEWEKGRKTSNRASRTKPVSGKVGGGVLAAREGEAS